ncbi:MAG: PP2C family protein-serine/threonine phosphatase [Candidatus Omnitrophica bacterium]|nr:PP2C family protein-serine/threonine phosphatase [Candidatus Omnitrophota bacterium]
MFKKKRIIPIQYQSEFEQQNVFLFRERIRLIFFLTVGFYLTGYVIHDILYLIYQYDFTFYSIEYTAFLALTFTILLLSIASKKTANLSLIKFYGYLTVFAIISFMSYLDVLYPTTIDDVVLAHLFSLFVGCFILPWTAIEIIPIIIIYFALYLLVSFYIFAHYAYLQTSAEINESWAMGIIFLSLSALLCFVVRKKETTRDVENFLLLKEVELKNQQMQTELELATRIHKTLIPKSISTNLADISVSYLPMSYIGGDYAKFHFIDDDKLLFFISDVTGHGVSAALLVNRIHSEFETIIKETQDPNILLERLNTFIKTDFKEIHMFLSAFCCLLDFSKMELTFANHGHPSQYLYRSRDSKVEKLGSLNMLLGIPTEKENTEPGLEKKISFLNKDKLILFTDGVTEIKNQKMEEFGTERFENFIQNHFALSAGIFNQKLIEKLNFFKDKEFQDDIFVLTIDIK